MAQTVDQAGEQIKLAKVVYGGEKIMLPDGMSVPDAIKVLNDRQKFLETPVNMSETFDVFPWDGAFALDKVLTDKFGWTAATATPGFFGPQPPSLISIDVGPNDQKASVPWGAFSLPGVDGLLQTGVNMKAGRLVFQLTAKVKRKDEKTVQDIFAYVRAYLKQYSIYRGKAIKMRFNDDDGEALEMPEPKFMDVSSIRRDQLIYSKQVMDAVETNLFTPIQRVEDCLRNDIPVKRGVLLGGVYGTGKTLGAMVAAKLAVEAGITFLYVARADELPKAVEFAKQYQSPACVVFCEDIDRVLDGERDVKMDDLLNIVDGVDSKHSHLIIVLTTNAMERINAAMLRPGRLDAVINVTPPDAEAVQRLVRYYGAGTIDPAADLTEVGSVLAGNIPATIAEVVKRAKLAQLKLQARGTPLRNISAAALVDAARSMDLQLQLLRDNDRPKTPDITLDLALEQAVGRALEQIGVTEGVQKLRARLGA